MGNSIRNHTKSVIDVHHPRMTFKDRDTNYLYVESYVKRFGCHFKIIINLVIILKYIDY